MDNGNDLPTRTSNLMKNRKSLNSGLINYAPVKNNQCDANNFKFSLHSSSTSVYGLQQTLPNNCENVSMQKGRLKHK